MPWHTYKILVGLRSFSSSKNKQGGSGQAEEERIDRYHIVKDLIVFSGQRDHCRPDTLQNDGDNWDTRSLAYASNRFEEYAIARHCIVDSRRGENALAEKSDS